MIALAAGFAAVGATAPRYPVPIELAVSPDGARLFVVCEGTDELVVIDALRSKFAGRVPSAACRKACGSRRTAARSTSPIPGATRSRVIDTAALTVIAHPQNRLRAQRGLRRRASALLYMANRISNDVSVIDLASGAETRRLLAGPRRQLPDAFARWRSALSHAYLSEPRQASARRRESEITVIDTARQIVARSPAAA